MARFEQLKNTDDCNRLLAKAVADGKPCRVRVDAAPGLYLAAKPTVSLMWGDNANYQPHLAVTNRVSGAIFRRSPASG